MVRDRWLSGEGWQSLLVDLVVHGREMWLRLLLLLWLRMVDLVVRGLWVVMWERVRSHGRDSSDVLVLDGNHAGERDCIHCFTRLRNWHFGICGDLLLSHCTRGIGGLLFNLLTTRLSSHNGQLGEGVSLTESKQPAWASFELIIFDIYGNSLRSMLNIYSSHSCPSCLTLLVPLVHCFVYVGVTHPSHGSSGGSFLTGYTFIVLGKFFYLLSISLDIIKGGAF